MRHLIFVFVDHFEPRRPEDMAAWVGDYPRVARPFCDSDGLNPQHTWFYDGEDPAVLEALGRLCRLRLGEVELHLHHGHDTAESLRALLQGRKERFAQHGALVTQSGGHSFGFIHGKWSLDNSRGDEFCGVNNELVILRVEGCFADFTFPAWGRMQPRKRNAIYYATDDPARAKSYDTGADVTVGGQPTGDLMILQGPGRLSGIPAKAARVPMLPRLADRLFLTCAMDAHLPPWPGRVDRWIRAGVGVKGRPEWVFVKVHTHGARPDNYGAYFGRNAEWLHRQLAERYNDGRDWRLHYATARQAYNMVKAAEAGRGGDPGQFRDFVIAPYQNTLT